ncbi:uncharacterized protein LOC110379463 isoform X1 [Helicoverpa armigera]|uniref:uncharacterized protein LOC110379463 isoform X1 n=1 Tax=Helicoverpa armigera TaxID=29058 RepID=UPI003082A7EC
MSKNILYKFYFLFICNGLIYTETSLLSRVKNPLEHFSETTIAFILPKNIYRYEPYRGHRTLWKPTNKNTGTAKPDKQNSRPTVKTKFHTHQVLLQDKRVTTKKTFWHHFDEDDEAWPKVVLILSSTGKTTTQKKIKKTFANYFPYINKNTQKQTVNPNDLGNTIVDEASEEMSTDYDHGKNWLPVNFVNTDESVHWEEDDTIDTTEPEVPVMLTLTREEVGNPEITTVTTEDNPEITTIGIEKAKNPGITTLMRERVQNRGETNLSDLPGRPVGRDWPTLPTPESTKSYTRRTRTTQKGTAQEDYYEHVEVKCYQCGLNETSIPRAPGCHQAFNSKERIYSYLRDIFKVTCIGTDQFTDIPKDDPKYFFTLPKRLYRGGCFKRYLDVGETYDERGCRTMNPLRGSSYASNRLMSLEKSMHHIEEGCVASPHASLTPLSRSVNLYARYHVCVCVGDYCNESEALRPNYIYLVWLYVFLWKGF